MTQEGRSPIFPGGDPPRRRSFTAFYLLTGGVALIFCWVLWYIWPGREVYMTPREVAGFFGETMELSRGRFRYWSYSDAGGDDLAEYPLTGTYSVEGNRLVLHHQGFQGKDSVRYLDRVNGVPVIWRDDGWSYWNEKKKIHAYGVMIRTDRALFPFVPPRRPSLKQLSGS